MPEGEQDAGAGALLDYVKHMRDMRLTDAQVAEARRRRADPDRKLLSHTEARERIGRLGSQHPMQLVFDDQAIVDLENIFAWIAQGSPATARAVIDRLFASIELMISFPRMGHVGRDPDTLEWVCRGCPTWWRMKSIVSRSELS
jgi:toxin ParE1/3/4